MILKRLKTPIIRKHPEAYKESMTAILNGLTSLTDAVVWVGFAAVDESKTSPKFNTITVRILFTNERIRNSTQL